MLDRESAWGVATLGDMGAWLKNSKAGPHLSGWDPGAATPVLGGVEAGFAPRGVAGRPDPGETGK